MTSLKKFWLFSISLLGPGSGFIWVTWVQGQQKWPSFISDQAAQVNDLKNCKSGPFNEPIEKIFQNFNDGRFQEDMPAEDYSELLEFYNLKETIGSGGFAKVKLGVHLLTKEKVAVKIVDKQSVGKDLPRVLLEIEALKNLVHHNVARLIQIFNTANKVSFQK